MAHLLLVDDEESLRSVVAERLTDEGYQVTEAADGEAALAALDGFAFDVIISDQRLPGVDGRNGCVPRISWTRSAQMLASVAMTPLVSSAILMFV